VVISWISQPLPSGSSNETNDKFDPFTPPGDGAAYRAHFTGKYAHRTLPVGHNVPQEDPGASPRP
jgi:hypothetical protein